MAHDSSHDSGAAHESHETHGAHGKAAPKKAGQLPTLVATPADISRLIREIEAIDAALLSHTLRKDGAEADMLRTSQLMNQMIELNGLNLLEQHDRQRLHTFLETVRERAPVLHMSFSADPSPAFMQKLMSWLRREIHPQVLLTVGLQPNIGAGCIVRSTNRYFDFSLRQDFAEKREMLRSMLAPGDGKAVV